MFNIGPLEFGVLAIVALIVIGPERLPALTKQAAQFIRTLRELATGAREQLRDELGPEFADLDLRNLNPRAAVTKAVFGDDFDPNRLNPRARLRDAILGDEDLHAADPRKTLRETRDDMRWSAGRRPEAGLGVDASDVADVEQGIDMRKPAQKPQSAPMAARPRPRPSPRPRTDFDDAT